jgi:hypothetical protein
MAFRLNLTQSAIAARPAGGPRWATILRTSEVGPTVFTPACPAPSKRPTTSCMKCRGRDSRFSSATCERRSKSDTKRRRVFFEHACCLVLFGGKPRTGSRASGAWRSEPLTSRRGDMLGHGSGGVRSHGSGFSPPFSVGFMPPTTPHGYRDDFGQRTERSDRVSQSCCRS